MKEEKLIKTGELEGFCPDDRVLCSPKCLAAFRGKTGTVAGFDESNNIWVKIDAQEGLFSVLGISAYKYLKKLEKTAS